MKAHLPAGSSGTPVAVSTSRCSRSFRTAFLASFFALVMLVSSLAAARVEFMADSFDISEFRNVQRLQEHCAAEALSFFCGRFDDELTLITTKGQDYVFNSAGEVVALFAKEQNGQDYNRRYSLDQNQNLIPYTARIPGGAVLVDGEYGPPENVEGAWQRRGRTEYVGTFTYSVEGVGVTKEIVVSHVSNTMHVRLQADRVDGADAAVTLAYGYPGIGRVDRPVVKIGQGENYTLNPLSQAIAQPAYASLQTNNRHSGFAIVMRPPTTTSALAAQFLPPDVIVMQTTLGADEGAQAVLDLQVYGGMNELVRFHQEGYADLPGLFSPNILGRMSIGVLSVLSAIHDVVGSWGLSIIVLTLIFRALVWPLITTQTRSMVGMQQLQPKMQALQKKYKDNREKLTQETMKLYQEAGVNPAGGCLPIFVQMPLFIILWRVFANFEFDEGFLWIPDLGLADPTYILPILYVGVMIGQSFLVAKGNPQALRMQLMINVVFIFFIINFPAGVTLYWVVSMLVQILQHWLIARKYPAPAPAGA